MAQVRRSALTTEQQRELWRRWRAGESLHEIARAFGRRASSIHGMIAAHGGYVPAARRRSPRVLSLGEREEISRGLAAGASLRLIARRLGRAPSTVSREVARHGGRRRYRALRADERAWRRARRPKPCKLAREPRLRALVAAKLGEQWSPEQISGWLARTYAGEQALQVSTETIYRSLFVQTRGVLAKELTAQLRTRRTMRRSKQASRKGGQRRHQGRAAHQRAPARGRGPRRARPLGGRPAGRLTNTHIATLVERQTRFLLLVKLEGRDSETVVAALAAQVQTLPAQLRRSLTWDRGAELAAHQRFSVATDVAVYFCDPRSPWQRGTNENTNGLLRQYFPKKTDLALPTRRPTSTPWPRASTAARARRLPSRPRLIGLQPSLRRPLESALTTEQQRELWRRWRAGESLREIARAFGRRASSIHGMIAAHGGYVPAARRRSPRVLSLGEREEISRGLAEGASLRLIARRLGRAPSTVSREVARHGGRRRYRALRADERAWRRARRPKPCKLAAEPRLRALVAAKLGEQWSPEQISGWLARTYAGEQALRVSTETIYRSLFVQARGVLAKELTAHLRTGRTMRRSKKRAARGAAASIRDEGARSASVRPRSRTGPSPATGRATCSPARQNTHIVTLVERQTRFLLLVTVRAKDTETVVDALAAQVQTLPRAAAQVPDLGPGRGARRAPALQHRHHVAVYFCDPRSPWQRGTNENTNGLLRQYFPKQTTSPSTRQAELDAVAAASTADHARRLPSRPRLIGLRHRCVDRLNPPVPLYSRKCTVRRCDAVSHT